MPNVVAYLGYFIRVHTAKFAYTPSINNPCMNNLLTIFVTTPNTTLAKTIAEALVDKKLAACVNIIPGITSVYKWDGEMRMDSEQLLVIKSSESRFKEIDEQIKLLHTYDNPEIIAFPVTAVSNEYRNWVLESTKI